MAGSRGTCGPTHGASWPWGRTSTHAKRPGLPTVAWPRIARSSERDRSSHTGTTAAIVGIGGLGHVAIQLVHALTAARVIAIDRSPEAIALADGLGADHTVLADGQHVSAVRALTDGRGVEVVFDFVGDSGTPAEGLAMLARRGRYTAVGYGGRIDIPTADLVVNEFEVSGSLIGTYQELGELVALAAQAQVRVTATPYPLAAFSDAVADLRAGRVQGRAVVIP